VANPKGHLGRGCCSGGGNGEATKLEAKRDAFDQAKGPAR
jgi:hypothetical protein